MLENFFGGNTSKWMLTPCKILVVNPRKIRIYQMDTIIVFKDAPAVNQSRTYNSVLLGFDTSCQSHNIHETYPTPSWTLDLSLYLKKSIFNINVKVLLDYLYVVHQHRGQTYRLIILLISKRSIGIFFIYFVVYTYSMLQPSSGSIVPAGPPTFNQVYFVIKRWTNPS